MVIFISQNSPLRQQTINSTQSVIWRIHSASETLLRRYLDSSELVKTSIWRPLPVRASLPIHFTKRRRTPWPWNYNNLAITVERVRSLQPFGIARLKPKISNSGRDLLYLAPSLGMLQSFCRFVVRVTPARCCAYIADAPFRSPFINARPIQLLHRSYPALSASTMSKDLRRAGKA